MKTEKDSRVDETPDGGTTQGVGSGELVRPPSLDEFLRALDMTRTEVVATGRRSKSGRLIDGDMRRITRAWTKLKAKKWAHLFDEYFALTKEGADQAVAELNPLANRGPNH